ncbi:MAG: hypothetical protein QW666_03090, partial [Candidatus Woesearchaeota archaeon]
KPLCENEVKIMEDKTVMYSIIGVVGIVVIVGFVLSFSGVGTGLGFWAGYAYPKVYGGGLKKTFEDIPFPYAEGRTVKGGVTEVPGYGAPVGVIESTEAYATTGYGMYRSRYPERIPTVMISCAGQVDYGNVPKGYVLTLSANEARALYGNDLNQGCVPAPQIEGMYCCMPR